MCGFQWLFTIELSDALKDFLGTAHLISRVETPKHGGRLQ